MQLMRLPRKREEIHQNRCVKNRRTPRTQKEEDIIKIQAQAGPYEQSTWKRKGATEKEGRWRSLDGRIVALSFETGTRART